MTQDGVLLNLYKFQFKILIQALILGALSF